MNDKLLTFEKSTLDVETERHNALTVAANQVHDLSEFHGIQHPKQIAFLQHYIKTRQVLKSCDVAGIHNTTFYAWKKDDLFHEAFKRAEELSKDITRDIFYERAHNGYDEPVYHQGGLVGTKKKHETSLLMRAMEVDHQEFRPHTRREVTGTVDHRHAHVLAAMEELAKLPPEQIDRIADGEDVIDV